MNARPLFACPLSALLGTLLLAGASQAALKKYETRLSYINQTTAQSPSFQHRPLSNPDGDVGLGLIDDGGVLPVVRRLTLPTDIDATIRVPDLSGFVWLSRKWTEGPNDDQSGVSGSSLDRIVWGTLTGWRITGYAWCNSEPATVCLLAGHEDDATADAPTGMSPFYDVGTWYFHGTGFTSRPFVSSRYTVGNPGGNSQWIARGVLAPDGSVPVLPLAGVALLGGCVAAAGLAALRRARP